ncbi:NACHT domain-containing protein [Colletotrichum musicola]|uniref:NACHT domain-containing protein n=1 Tax=Colletotrichum musicola TaxID=2175873 RepID=A0A8H6JT52_9PEZI|nr:NACHT domain-containing protein [Colletotrichum musicola]
MENLSTAVGTVAKLKPEIRLAQAISEFSVCLSGDKDRHAKFKNLQTRRPPNPLEVLQLTEEINRDGARRHKSWRPFATRLVAILDRIRQFAPIGDVLIGGSQNLLACGVWAAVRMALEISLSFLSYFDRVSNLLLRIGRSVSLHQDFAMLSPQCQQVQGYMCEYIIVIVDISKKIVTHARKSLASQVASLFGSSFDSVFKSLETDLAEWGRLIEKRTAMLVAKSTLQEQSSSLEWFNRLQITTSREAAKRNREARKHRILEFLCPDQKEFDLIWQWLKCPVSSSIWLQGNLGSGKTVTMASAIADLVLTKWDASSGSPTKQRPRTVSYFFCKSNIQKTLHVDNILASIAYQVLSSPILASTIEQFLDRTDGSPTTSNPEAYIQLILDITPPNWEGVFVLDGLDEAPYEEMDELFIQIKRLMTTRHVRLCCSSRPTSRCKTIAESILQINATLSMEHADRSGDILSYISAEVERWKLIRPFSAELEQLITRQLLVGSQGMFQWLSLQIEAICPKYIQELRSEAEIFNIINNPPRNLPEAFDQALLRIPDHRYNSRIFQLVAAADPYLSIDELRIAVNIEPGILAWNSSSLVGSGHTLESQYGGSLLDIDEEDHGVRFIHHSALLHLAGRPAIRSAAPFHFDFQESEVTLGAVCVTYLNYSVFENRVSTAQKVSFARVPQTVAESALPSNRLSQKVMRILSKDKRSNVSKVDLERLASDLLAHRFKVHDDVQLFLPYAQAYWLIMSKSFSEAIDPAVYSLWKMLLTGSVPSISGSLPWDAGSAASAAEWAIHNNHGFLFRHLMFNSDADSLSEVLSTTVRLAKEDKKSQAMVANGLVVEGGQQVFNLSGEALGPLVPVYLMNCMQAMRKIEQSVFLDPMTAELSLNAIARSAITHIFTETCRSPPNTCMCDPIIYLTNYLPHVDALLDNGMTLLHTAIQQNHERLAWTLLTEHGADPNGSSVPGFPSPLQLCLQQDRSLAGLAGLLVDLGADVLANPDNDIPPFFLAISIPDFEIFDLLRGAGAYDRTRRYGSEKETAFQFACRKYCEPRLREYPYIILNTLLKDGADVNSRNGSGETPLLMASRSGTAGMVTRLLELGADPNVADVHGNTPLLMASRSGTAGLVMSLLNMEADPNVADVHGATPLHYAHGNVAAKLIEYGARPDEVCEGVTPLMAASHQGDVEAVKALLQSGSDTNHWLEASPVTAGNEVLHWRLRMTENRSEKNALLINGPKVALGDTALSMEMLLDGFEKEKVERIRHRWATYGTIAADLIDAGGNTVDALKDDGASQELYESIPFWQPILSGLRA